MDFKSIFFKFVRTTKYILLWEKEIKNQEEEKSMPEAMEKEDLENLQNRLLHPKKNLKSKRNKKT